LNKVRSLAGVALAVSVIAVLEWLGLQTGY
jgi:hypothetical protein